MSELSKKEHGELRKMKREIDSLLSDIDAKARREMILRPLERLASRGVRRVRNEVVRFLRNE